jgi:hypothetical protein
MASFDDGTGVALMFATVPPVSLWRSCRARAVSIQSEKLGFGVVMW